MEYVSLSITAPGPCTLPNAKVIQKNYTKPDFMGDISDIDGTRSRAEPYPRNSQKFVPYSPDSRSQQLMSAGGGLTANNHANSRPDANPKVFTKSIRNVLEIDDIDGTRPKKLDKIYTSGRHCDPLNPTYSLPSSVPAGPMEKPYLRDPLHIDDIDKTRSNPLYKFPMRESKGISDIEGTQVGSHKSKVL